MNIMLPYLKKAFGFTKKAILVITVYIVILGLFAKFSASDKSAQTVDPLKKNQHDIYKTIHDPKLNSTKEGKMAVTVYRLTLCSMIGEACTDNPADAEKNFNHSMFGGVTNLIAMPYAAPPASGVAWVRQGLENASFIPKTYAAQGIGFAGLKPIQKLWQIFRNFAYLVLVLVIVAIGFMIMFRAKVNPQTVVSVENALPRIIIALFLITFSFAIGGFLIDFMYITIVFGISVVSQANVGSINPTPDGVLKLQNQYLGATFGDLWLGTGTAFNVGYAIVEVLPNFIKNVLKGAVALPVTLLAGRALNHFYDIFAGSFNGLLWLGGSSPGITGGVGLGGFIPFLLKIGPTLLLFVTFFPLAAGFVIAVIFAITLLFFMFRIFFLLLTSYIKILLFIIFSPVILLFVAIPGRPVFSWWFKNLFAELMTFPIVIILLLVGRVITHFAREDTLLRPPFMYNIEPEPFVTLLGVGLILMTPGLIKSAKAALGAKGVGGLGAGVFFGGVGALAGGGGALAQKFYYAQHVPVIGGWLQNLGKSKHAGTAARIVGGPDVK